MSIENRLIIANKQNYLRKETEIEVEENIAGKALALSVPDITCPGISPEHCLA